MDSTYTATLTVPAYTNAGDHTNDLRAHVRERLITFFGGCTETIARGYWRGEDREYHEDVHVYTVHGLEDVDRWYLRALAEHVRDTAAQEAVAVTFALSTFELI